MTLTEEFKEMQKNCNDTHKDVSKDLSDIKAMMATFGERFTAVFGKLEDGKVTFGDIMDDIKEVRATAERNREIINKARYFVAGVMFFAGIVGYFANMAWAYIKERI